jgi:hypothetical protein
VVDRELEEIPQVKEYSEEIIKKVMTDNVVLIENPNAI